jgi:hypothetical protein
MMPIRIRNTKLKTQFTEIKKRDANLTSAEKIMSGSSVIAHQREGGKKMEIGP